MKYIIIPVAIVLIALVFVFMFGCAKGGDNMPGMLDGDGMVYIDSEHRTDYANVLYNDDNAEDHNGDYFAIAYLGKGEVGRENAKARIDSLFGGKLTEEQIAKIEHFDFGGDDWFLVVPRYKDHYDIFPKDKNYSQKVIRNGEAFIVNCGDATIEYYSHGGYSVELKADENGRINIDCVWDITSF